LKRPAGTTRSGSRGRPGFVSFWRAERPAQTIVSIGSSGTTRARFRFGRTDRKRTGPEVPVRSSCEGVPFRANSCNQPTKRPGSFSEENCAKIHFLGDFRMGSMAILTPSRMPYSGPTVGFSGLFLSALHISAFTGKWIGARGLAQTLAPNPCSNHAVFIGGCFGSEGVFPKGSRAQPCPQPAPFEHPVCCVVRFAAEALTGHWRFSVRWTAGREQRL